MSVFDDDTAAERKQKKAQTEAAKLKEFYKANAVQSLYQTREGRTYLNWLLEITGVAQTPYRRDPHDTAFLCGEQNVGLRLQAHMMETDPTAYVEMLKENANGTRTQPRSGSDSEPGLFDGDESEPGPDRLDSEPESYT